MTGIQPVKCRGGMAVRSVLLALIVLFAARMSTGQTAPLEARIASVTGMASVTAPGGQPITLTPGADILPGEEIDTRGGGRATLVLTDGSMVIIEPQTILLLKDFRTASNIRDLLEITVGRIRVKINHFGGKPNPYRMNSPTASISVRGTEFSVVVDAQGTTQVIVYEGTVEVTSLTDPAARIILESGQGAMIRLNGSMQMLQTPQAEKRVIHEGAAAASPRSNADTYERYIANLATIGQTPGLLRFNAFPERFLDSLQNPAYATDFKSAEGEAFLLPSLTGLEGLPRNSALFGSGTGEPTDRGLTGQATYFYPIRSFVVGASLASSGIETGPEPPSSRDFNPAVINTTASATNSGAGSGNSSFLSGSAIVSKHLGENSGVGFEVQQLKGNGAMLNLNAAQGAISQDLVEKINSQSNISQTNFTLGLNHAFGPNHEGGVLFRYGLLEADDYDVLHTIGTAAAPLESTRARGHTAEVSFRLRGILTPKLIYGVEASLLGVSLNSSLVRASTANSIQGDRAQRAMLGYGIGYLLNRKTVLSFDVGGGWAGGSGVRADSASGLLLQQTETQSRFLSFQAGIQRTLWRKVFATASFLGVVQSHALNFNVYPDANGNAVAVSDFFLPLTQGSYLTAPRSADIGLGWNIRRDLMLQYLYSTDFEFSAEANTVMLRYSFGSRSE